MLQLTTNTVLWDEKQTVMEMEIPRAPVTMAVDSLQAPISPFSLRSPVSSPSPSPAKRNEKPENQEPVSTGSIIFKPSHNNNPVNTNTNSHQTRLTELAADLAKALSYTEGYGPDRGKQTEQESLNVYELQKLTRHPSVCAAELGVEDSYCSARPISRRIRAERRARRFALV